MNTLNISKLLTKEKFYSYFPENKNNKYTTIINIEWEYYENIINIIKNIGTSNIIEIGSTTNIYEDSYSMYYTINKDKRLNYIPKIRHDLKVLPYPIKNKQYEALVSVQTYQHIKNISPENIIKELSRISNHIILVIPLYYANKYKNIDNPQFTKCKYSDNVILYWNLNNKPIKKNIVNNESEIEYTHKGNTSKIKIINDKVYKTVNYKTYTNELIKREIYWLKKLESYNISPRFIKQDGNTIIMSYCGETVKKEQLTNELYIQLLDILKILNQNKCYYTDFKLENFTIKNDKLYIIDFGWCSEIIEDYSCGKNVKSQLYLKPTTSYEIFNTTITQTINTPLNQTKQINNEELMTIGLVYSGRINNFFDIWMNSLIEDIIILNNKPELIIIDNSENGIIVNEKYYDSFNNIEIIQGQKPIKYKNQIEQKNKVSELLTDSYNTILNKANGNIIHFREDDLTSYNKSFQKLYNEIIKKENNVIAVSSVYLNRKQHERIKKEQSLKHKISKKYDDIINISYTGTGYIMIWKNKCPLYTSKIDNIKTHDWCWCHIVKEEGKTIKMNTTSTPKHWLNEKDYLVYQNEDINSTLTFTKI